MILNRDCLTFSGAGMYREILDQAEPPLRDSAQVAMLQAAQELFLATRWKHVPPPDLICAQYYVEWRFAFVSYIFVPQPNDQLLEIFADATKRVESLVLLIPSDHEFLVRGALERQRKSNYSGLFTVEDYLAWRMIWAGTDVGWSRQKVILWWLSRYNRFVRRRKLPESLIVRLSKSSSVIAP